MVKSPLRHIACLGQRHLCPLIRLPCYSAHPHKRDDLVLTTLPFFQIWYRLSTFFTRGLDVVTCSVQPGLSGARLSASNQVLSEGSPAAFSPPAPHRMETMAESVLVDHPDLSSLTGSPGQKRKRESSSPGLSRNKRPAPAAHMTDTSFMDSALDPSQTGGVSVADFNALQQAAQAEHTEAPDPTSATSTAQAALGMYPTLHVPPSTEEQFAAQANEVDHNHDNSFNDVPPPPDSLLDPPQITPPQHQQTPPNGVQQHSVTRYATSANPKPTVGSEEWHKMRKDNHKEVERRRRETINEGINELAKIVPGCEKNKGSILQRAVSFISQLKENEQQNIEKWTLEKLLTEQAITELSASNDKLKQECERLYRELETWKRVAQNAGLEPPQPKEENLAAPVSS